jgi:hypothetical protein
MFHLAFGAVRLAIWERPEHECVLTDFKALIQRQLSLFTAPV